MEKSFLERFKSMNIPESSALDQDFSARENSAACNDLKNNKSGGSDGVLNKMLKVGQFSLLPCFSVFLTTF